MTTTLVTLNGGPITTGDLADVARNGVKLIIGEQAQEKILAGRALLEQVLGAGATHYGVNTGFGALGRMRIEDSALEQLQLNLVRSHSTGVGNPLPIESVRATMALLAASLSRGCSGVRLHVVEQIVALLNHGITPVVPETGSVGASGDLAPLAHIASVLLGEGDAFVGQARNNDSQLASVAASVALNNAGLTPITLQAKEGLALINGTHLMAGEAALLVEDFEQLFEAALIAATMSVDSCRATDATLDERVHAVRKQLGQIYVAARMRQLLNGSEIVKSHLENDPRVQDPYSFRCCPAVLGAAWDAYEYVKTKVADELSAVTDNPLVFPGRLDSADHGEVVSGGNFHGMPIALPLDMLAICLTHVAGISERRIFHMLSGVDPEAELPSFLTPQAGLQSGLMIAQYAAAACCNELIGLANPASVMNLSTSAGMEDYNSFGPRSAAKARRAIQLTRSVVAIELLCAATGLDHHRPLRSGETVERAYDTIREEVEPLVQDRSPAPDIRAIENMIQRGRFALDV